MNALKRWILTRGILYAIGDKMDTIRTWLQGKKTYLVCAAGVLAAVVAFADGQMAPADVVKAVIEALAVASLRAGVGGTQKT